MVVFLCIVFVRDRSGKENMMNTLHKFLAVYILAVSIFISGVAVDFVGGTETGDKSYRRDAGRSAP